MKILHSSDWHLGQNFFARSRLQEHQAFIDYLLQLIETQQIDALIIAGDIFDTAAPPSYARELYFRLLAQLHQLAVQVIIVAGNHDSFAVLNEARQLLGYLKVQVITACEPADCIVTLRDKNGDAAAYVAAVPYLRARELQQSQAGESASDKEQQLASAIYQYYQQAYQQMPDDGLPRLATGHLTFVGAQMSESVRELYIGNLQALTTAGLPRFDYLALGHIHKAQALANQAYYCGSPLPLSFDEASQPKQLNLLNIDNGQVTVEYLTLPCFRPLLRLQGSLNAIKSQLLAYQCSPQALTPWLEVQVNQEDGYLSELHQQLQHYAEQAGVELLKVSRAQPASVQLQPLVQRQSLQELTPEQVFAHRLSQQEFDEQQSAQLTELFKQLMEQMEQVDDEDPNAAL